MIDLSEDALDMARDHIVDNLDELKSFGMFYCNSLCLTRQDGAMDLYDGDFRAIDAEGNTIFDHVPASDYLKYLEEEVKPWSYMKFPFIKSLGPEKGWYRVGPLSRINTCNFIDTPRAEAARRDFKAFFGERPCNIGMAYHWARMIEFIHAAEKIRLLVHDPDLQGKDLVVSGDRREEAVAVIETPRGTLLHHYKVNENDQVVMANLVVSTTQNNEPMNRAVGQVAANYLDGANITEGLLNRIEAAVRAYDPCLSCATHAVGKMPLTVELLDINGTIVGFHLRR